ncbi:M48 family metallopeptidase [Mangrovimonas sp. DI 80]|uniref:M48 family metallopeptidase n=1 Tax=Mangrovimonas sp. DI 80 TaxID=1779330 RepID=UPI000978857B|nr:YgjP-like metallopeptidase domain-containing protein [Mangrovimonas sp. DI 80]OMP29692.1 metal-dependent hydrolase [Mangrovimonas sp. DI 80]
MPKVQYGNKTIEYTFQTKEGLKSHYISVEKGDGVILKGKSIPEDLAHKLILKKATWILDKLELVSAIMDDDIVTGSRIQYLGRKYYVELFINNELDNIEIDFTESKFKVTLPKHLNEQPQLKQAFAKFFKTKAKEKIAPRVRKWSKTTGLTFNELKFRQLEKRWGSCTSNNNIIINIEAVKLPFSLIDYLIVHELTHTKVKNHSKEFWAELSKHILNWKELDSQMYGMKL